MTTTTPTAHGLEGEWTTPDWPPITHDFARRVVAHYPALGDALKILTVSPRPFSSASLVLTGAGAVFLKRHSMLIRTPHELEEEHRFLAHLAAQNFPVPRVLRDSQGRSAIEVENWTCEIQSVPEGLDLYRDAISWTPFTSIAHASSAGELLGRFHLAAQNFSAPPRDTRHLVSSFTIFSAPAPLAALKQFLASRPRLRAYLKATGWTREAFTLLAPFHARLSPLLPALGSQWTHNDWHASNLLWSNSTSGAHAVATIDFGLADRATALHDLTLAIERNAIGWLSLGKISPLPMHIDHARALIAGYASTRPFTRAEAAALAPMLALAHAEFALSEADYFLAVLNSESKARLAVEGYLLGHARWFASNEGSTFLNAIEEAALGNAR